MRPTMRNTLIIASLSLALALLALSPTSHALAQLPDNSVTASGEYLATKEWVALNYAAGTNAVADHNETNTAHSAQFAAARTNATSINGVAVETVTAGAALGAAYTGSVNSVTVSGTNYTPMAGVVTLPDYPAAGISASTATQIAEAVVLPYTNGAALGETASQPGHGHVVGDVTGLQTALDGKASTSDVAQVAGDLAALTPADIGAASQTHAHAVGDVTGLQTALDGKATTNSVTDHVADPTAAHAASAISATGRYSTMQEAADALANVGAYARMVKTGNQTIAAHSDVTLTWEATTNAAYTVARNDLSMADLTGDRFVYTTAGTGTYVIACSVAWGGDAVAAGINANLILKYYSATDNRTNSIAQTTDVLGGNTSPRLYICSVAAVSDTNDYHYIVVNHGDADAGAEAVNADTRTMATIVKVK